MDRSLTRKKNNRARTASLAAVGCVALAVACGRTDQKSEPKPTPGAPPIETTASRVGPEQPPPTKPLARHAKDLVVIPVEFPEVELDAVPGQYALAPPREWLDEAIERGVERQPFVFYGGKVVELGARGSTIATLLSKKSVLPNALVVPIRRGETAKVGNVVLTFLPGLGLQRAIVVAGGEPGRPRVRYLDIPLDSATGWGTRPGDLDPDTFHVLKQPGEPGTTLSCRDGEDHRRWVVVRTEGGRALSVGYAGMLEVRAIADCAALPIRPRVKAGDEVAVPMLGRFVSRPVVRVDAESGRVVVVEPDGENERAIGYPDVAKPPK